MYTWRGEGETVLSAIKYRTRAGFQNHSIQLQFNQKCFMRKIYIFQTKLSGMLKAEYMYILYL